MRVQPTDSSTRSAIRRAVQKAVAAGTLSRTGPCEACGFLLGQGRRASVLHHWDYSPERWTDCLLVCGPCHKAIHMGKRPEPRTGRMYEPHALGGRGRKAA